MKRIVILGGGFGGLEAARSARKKFDGEIVLIDHSPKMTYHGFLHYIISEKITPEEIEIDIESALNKIHVNFLQAEVKGMKKGFVETDKGKVKYDSLIIAMGSKTCFAVKGIRRCDELKQISQAKIMHDHLMSLDNATIVVVGAGVTGTELIFEINELAKKYNKKFEIHLIESNKEPMNNFSEKAKEIVKNEIKKLGIKEHYDKKIIFSTLHEITFENKEKLNYDLLIWTAGIEPVASAKIHGIESNKGFIKVNEHLETTSRGIFAIGDVAWFGIGRTHELWTAMTAKNEGKIAGINAANYLNHEKMKKYNPEKKHLFVITLGNNGLFIYGKKIIFGKWPIKLKKTLLKKYINSRK